MAAADPTRGDGTPREPIASATVLLVRDGVGGLEVFMIERHGLSDVHGGACVFPGGKLDAQDSTLSDRLDLPAHALREALAEPDATEAFAAALYVAALRELHEETGVLLAPPGAASASVGHGTSFSKLARRHGRSLAASGLRPWSRWITPAASVRARKHFDTRFFVAPWTSDHRPVHDDHEAVASVWYRPRQALRDYEERRIQLAPPQIMTLVELAGHADVASVWAHAHQRPPPRIQPEVFEEDGSHVVCYPGDARHTRLGTVLPGPTRLYWRHDRYEPEFKLESWLSEPRLHT